MGENPVPRCYLYPVLMLSANFSCIQFTNVDVTSSPIGPLVLYQMQRELSFVKLSMAI